MVIHLGGNDLGLLSGKALVMQVLEDLQVIHRHWESIRVIWSTIVPRYDAWDPKALNKAQCNANREIGRELQWGLRLYLPHPT